MSLPPFNDDAFEDTDASEEAMPGMRIIEGEEDATVIEDEAPEEEQKIKSPLEELEEAEATLDDVPMAFGDEEAEE